MLRSHIAANLSGLTVRGNVGRCQFHISWPSKSLEGGGDAAAVQFSSPHTQLVSCTWFLSGYLISIDVLMSLASQIPFKQGDMQHNATRLFSFDSSPLSAKRRWHISHRGIVAFSPWLLLAFLFNVFLQRWQKAERTELSLPVQSEDLQRCGREDHPQLSTNKWTVLELEHRGLLGNLKKSKCWSWVASKVELKCLCFHLFFHIQGECPAK